MKEASSPTRPTPFPTAKKSTSLRNFGLAALASIALVLPAAAVTIDWVTVGNAGNANDTTGYGGVAYTYKIARNETTIGQYCEFLNAVAKSDPYALYNPNMASATYIAGISRSGSNGSYSYSVIGSTADKPITYVSWFDAARFCNWMHNGQGSGSTETGAYTLNGAMSGIYTVSPGAKTWIPSENEWYKAAYYDPTKGGTGGYWLYPTQSDSLNGNYIGNPNSANYYYFGFAGAATAWRITDVGAYGANSASFYGTNDQGGNVWEWNDAIPTGGSRGMRGGSWNSTVDSFLRSSGRNSNDPTWEGDEYGFRVAGAPQPTATSQAASAITSTGATLNGSVNANGVSTTASFEYGLTTAYGTVTAAVPATITGSTATAVSCNLSGLQPGTAYHFHVIASSSGSVVKGADVAFTTLSNNANLASMALNAGSMVPGFAKGTTTYLATVPFATASVTVTPVTDHPTASVKVNGNTVVSGAASAAINLPVGNTALNTVVTAQDGVTTKTYVITVTRLPQAFVFNAATDVPVTANGFATGGYPATLTLNYAPAAGTVLTMVNNTGLGFIAGTFANLAQGQRVTLAYGGNNYDFAANYFGGTGNDLVLQWADTKVAAWGSNSYGQLADTTTISRLLPTLIDASGVLAGKTVVAVAEGYLHSLALCADGTLAAWGYNVFGQLGNGSAVPSSVPMAVDRTGALAGKTVVAVAAGPFHNLALCADGTVLAWGNNNYGQLGDGSRVTRRVPVRVSPVGVLAGKQVVAVAAAAYSSFALCDDGTVAAWGYNDEGELGNSGSSTSLVPVAVTTTGALSGKRVSALAAGQYHTLALCTDGTLVSWGYNNRGQLGNNSTTSSSQPVVIGSFGALAGKTPVGIGAGAFHSLARCADGTVAAWGSNNLGQLGVAGTVPSPVPVAISLAAASKIAAGGSHSLARGTDGTLFAWGDNADGQLGDNSTTSRAVPAAVDFAAISTGTRVMGVASSSAARHNLALVALAVPTGKAVRQANAAIAAAAAGDDLLSVAFGLTAGQFPQPQRVGDDFVVRFTQPAGVAGIRYGAEWTATLLPDSWQDLPDTGTDGEHRFAIPAAGLPQGFLRLKVTRE